MWLVPLVQAAQPLAGRGESRAVMLAVGVAYGVVVAGIGVWAARRTRTADDFFVAGRRLGVVTMTIAAMAATLSGFAFIGGPGLVYTLGMGALFINLPLAVTTTMGASVLARRLRMLADHRDIVTIPDAIGARYGSPMAQGLAGLAIAIATVGYMATNLLALGVVIDTIFSTGLATGVVIGAVVTVAYSATGGILAGVYTDLFQGIVMAAASLVTFGYALRAGGGLAGISASIIAADPSFLGPWGRLTPLAALSLWFVFGIGALGQPHVIHKFLMLRDPARLRWYPLAMTVAMTLTLLLFVGVGLVVRALVSSGAMPPLARPDDATPMFLLRHTPSGVAALVFAGVVAAIMSTVNSFLNVGAAALVHDIPRALGRPVADELRAARWATTAIALAATLVALRSHTLVAFLGIFGWGLFASTIVPALAVGINWAGATRAGAVSSIATGLTVTLALESLAWFGAFRFPSGVTATAVALVCSLAVFFVVSWTTRRTASASLPADVRAVVEG